MISAEEVKKTFKTSNPEEKYPQFFADFEKSLKQAMHDGDRTFKVWTTSSIGRDEVRRGEILSYVRKHGYRAEITDIYNSRTGQKGGSYMLITIPE